MPDAEVGVPARGPGLPLVDSDGLALGMFGCDVADPMGRCGIFPGDDPVGCCRIFPGDDPVGCCGIFPGDDDVPCCPICDHRTCGCCC